MRFMIAILVTVWTVCATASAMGQVSAVDEYRTLNERAYCYHEPATLRPDEPLVVYFHGLGGDCRNNVIADRWRQKSDAAGFRLVMPQGTGTPRGWNACSAFGEVCPLTYPPAMDNDVDDLAYFDALRALYEVDQTFVSGMSNGGMMAYHVACHRDVDAAGAVAATLVSMSCLTPVERFLHQHGNQDQTIPLSGGGPYNAPPVALGFGLFEHGVLETYYCYHGWPGVGTWLTCTQAFRAENRLWDFFMAE